MVWSLSINFILVSFQPFDDSQYSEVRKGPLYVPGQASDLPPEPSPPPSMPLRDSMGTSAGLSELDSLLEMLNDTQIKVDKGRVFLFLSCMFLFFFSLSKSKILHIIIRMSPNTKFTRM